MSGGEVRVTRTSGWLHDGDRMEILVGEEFRFECTLEKLTGVVVEIRGERRDVQRLWATLLRWSCRWTGPMTALETGETWRLGGRGTFSGEINRRREAVGALRVAASAALLVAGAGGKLVVEGE